jgi:hypothetical protein
MHFERAEIGVLELLRGCFENTWIGVFSGTMSEDTPKEMLVVCHQTESTDIRGAHKSASSTCCVERSRRAF